MCVGEVWVSQNERNISKYNKKRHSLLRGVQKGELVWVVPTPSMRPHFYLSLTFTEIQCSLVFLLCLCHFFICDRISTDVFAVISSWGPGLHAFSCQNTHTAGRWCSLSLLREHAAKKKAYFSQRSSSLTPPASISQVITSLTLIFTLNQNTLMRIRAFLAKNVSHTGNNLNENHIERRTKPYPETRIP